MKSRFMRPLSMADVIVAGTSGPAPFGTNGQWDPDGSSGWAPRKSDQRGWDRAWTKSNAASDHAVRASAPMPPDRPRQLDAWETNGKLQEPGRLATETTRSSLLQRGGSGVRGVGDELGRGIGGPPAFVDSKLDIRFPLDAWQHKVVPKAEPKTPPCVGIECYPGTTIPPASECVPKCWQGSGQPCGPDGCGGWCGTCSNGWVCGGQGKCVPYLLDGGYPEFAKTPAQKQALNLLWKALQVEFAELFSSSCDELWARLEMLDQHIMNHPTIVAKCEKSFGQALSSETSVSAVASLLQSACGLDCTGQSSGECIRNYIVGPDSPCPECDTDANPPACRLSCYFKTANGLIGCYAGKAALTNPQQFTLLIDAGNAQNQCLKYSPGIYAPTATAEEYLAILGPQEWMKIYLLALDVLAVALVKGCDWAHLVLGTFLVFQAPGWAPWNQNWAPTIGYDKKFFACSWAWIHLSKQLTVETSDGSIAGSDLLQAVGSPPGCPPKETT